MKSMRRSLKPVDVAINEDLKEEIREFITGNAKRSGVSESVYRRTYRKQINQHIRNVKKQMRERFLKNGKKDKDEKEKPKRNKLK